MFKFTLLALKQYLKINAFDPKKFTDLMNNLGLEIEEIIDLQKIYKDFVFAEIKSFEKHPDADKLNVCKVLDGKNELQIVCGAPNVRANMKVILSPVGTIIPINQMKIKKSKIRGVESNGMLCSAAELDFGAESDGIMDMSDQDVQVGDQILNFFNLNDHIIKVGVTPNRGDCLNIFGIARDLHGAGFGILKPMNIEKVEENFQSRFKIDIQAMDKVSRFWLREFRDLQMVETPLFIQDFMQKTDMKSINFFVDLANYLMMMLGCPIHVYDADQIKQNEIVVRELDKNLTYMALGEQEITLTNGDIMIIEPVDRVLCLAGIMGGLDSGVSANTQNILVEVGHFNQQSIMQTTQRLGLHSEAAYRFARGTDREMIPQVMKIFSEIVTKYSGGKASEIIRFDASDQKTREIQINWDFFQSLIGDQNISISTAEEILLKLGFEKNDDNNFKVPSWRNDVSNEEDLFEEVVRIFGIDRITSKPYIIENFLMQDADKKTQQNLDFTRNAREILKRDMHETITWSFMYSKKAAFFVENHEKMLLQNPIIETLDCMRPTLLSNLLEQVEENFNRDVKRLAIFEIGNVYNEDVQEFPRICGILIGNVMQHGVHESERKFDVFDAKQKCENVLSVYGIDCAKLKYEKIEQSHPIYKENKSVKWCLGNKKVAIFGQLNPNFVKKYYNIVEEVFAFEIFLENIAMSKKPDIAKLFIENKILPVERDLAFVFDERQDSLEIVRFIKKISQLISHVQVFDIFVSENMKKKGKKSLAFKMNFQAVEKTLTDDEINVIFNKIIAEVVEKFDAALRDNNYLD